ncbi:DUF3180 domain-containing protein [Cellulosimicrobium sp. CUA-896]|uniref:DUF3180 domain-containing protein n=1 Tax=Cellulosimicrobium sp. CUA-896 TaxID=1517881 RepID=UPI000964515C|nr:DUF3180 domain-containing protein [Cellulosimicrobium sp. CUA-896]OLT48110.1 hypothetical protein BJF88_03315 [Cellulosimicrobium sp. CUA-896]
MRRTPVRNLLLVAVVTAVAGWLVVRALEGTGTYLPPVSWVVDVAIVALALAVLWAGWTVRAYQKGRRPGLDAIRAARTFVLAKAAALTGALLAGWYGAQVLVTLPDLAIEPRRERAVAAGVAVACAVVLAVAGLVAERFCQLPPRDGNDERDGATREDPETPGASTTA